MKQKVKFTRKRSFAVFPLFLTCVSAAGMTATVIFAVRATPKAAEHIEQAKREKGETLTRSETIRAAAPCYIPTAMLGTLTVLCMFGANAVGNKQRAAYISAYSMLEKAFGEYRAKAMSIYGESADNEIRSAVAEYKRMEHSVECVTRGVHKADETFGIESELLTFYDEYSGEFYERTIVEVLNAAYHLNRNYTLRGYSPLNEFYDFLDLPHIESGDMLGWSQDIGEIMYGYMWIDIDLREKKLDDGMRYFIIDFPFPPTSDYGYEPD